MMNIIASLYSASSALSPLTLFALSCLFLLILYQIITLFLGIRKLRKIVDEIPGPGSGSVLLGHLALMREIRNNVTNWYQLIFAAFVGIAKMYQMQDIGFIRLWFGPSNPVVVVLDAECAEGILTSNINIRKSKEFDFSIPWLGLGLFTATGDRWRMHRKMLTPAFHFRILESFVPIIQKQQLIMMEEFRKRAEKNHGIIDDVKPLITNCALDIICETAMGVTINAQTDPNCRYSREVRSVLDLFMLRFLSPWLWNDWLFALSPTGRKQKETIKFLHNFTENVIKRKRIELENKLMNSSQINENQSSDDKKPVLAFLDSLLMQNIREPNSFTDEDIRSEVDTFMAAGQDTSSATIQFALQLIGNHTDVQAKIHDELDNIFGDSDRPLKFDDLREMKYLERVIKETLRLFPPVLFIARQIEQEMIIKDKKIPKGVTLLVLFYQLHRDPKYFPNPERFDPDRFGPENASGRHAFSFTPFSAGPRNCIGQRFALQTTKALIACILRKYQFESLLPMDKVELAIGSTMGPKNPIPIRIRPRAHLSSQ